MYVVETVVVYMAPKATMYDDTVSKERRIHPNHMNKMHTYIEADQGVVQTDARLHSATIHK